MDKQTVIAAILTVLRSELAALAQSNADARGEAQETKPENQYDTRGLEASYLASAQVDRMLEVKQLIGFYEVFQPRSFGPDDPISVGALIELEEERVWWCFLAPQGGGVRVEGVTVLSPKSPLGRALVGATEGDEVAFQTPKGPRTVEVLTLQ